MAPSVDPPPHTHLARTRAPRCCNPPWDCAPHSISDESGLFVYVADTAAEFNEARRARGALEDDICREVTSDARWLREHTDLVHMSIFIGMCLYFITIYIALFIHGSRIGRTARDPYGLQRYKNQIKYLCAQAQANESDWPKVTQTAQKDATKATALKEGDIDMVGYLQAHSMTTFTSMIAFPPSTWLVALVHQLIIGLMSKGCVHILEIHLIEMGIYLAVTVKMSLRVLTYRWMLNHGSHKPYPFQWFGRFVTWPLGPFIDGFRPWTPKPNHTLAVSAQMSWVWYNLYRIAYAVTNEDGVLYRKDVPAATNADLVLSGVATLVWPLLIWPMQLEMAVLPPFTSHHNDKALCEALEHRPGKHKAMTPARTEARA